MKTTDELMKEHRGIERMLRILKPVAAKMEKGDEVEWDDLNRIVEFFSVFADKCHHGKEEDILFPALEGAGIQREGGPIGVMLAEHVKGRALIQRLREALEGCRAGRAEARGEFAAAAREYTALLNDHILKEDNVLYRMAEGRVAPEKDAAMLEAFERLEQERIGPGKHEEFHALLDRLGKKYPA